MFTGIIETIGLVQDIRPEAGNIHLRIASPIWHELRVDQSVSHNGVCLTVTAVGDGCHEVTAIQETLDKTNLRHWKAGDRINLERCMSAGGRFDGHIVQGHVDQVARCIAVRETNGSWAYRFEYDPAQGHFTVEKGSICVNGVSLTVVGTEANSFGVAIIPYTYTHTNFQDLIVGSEVNLEFDILGKYIQTLLARSGRI